MEGLVGKASPSPIGSDLWEYLLVAHPDEKVNEKIQQEKMAFYNRYQQKVAIKAKPHITVANFLGSESMEETLIRWIHRICIQQKSFTITLNNYGGFPEHTIYLRVQDHQPLRQMAMQLKPINEYIRSNGYPTVRFITHPHLSIARSLPADVYRKAMFYYSPGEFHESFLVDKLILLKRNSQFSSCRQVNVFGLYPPDTNIYGHVA